MKYYLTRMVSVALTFGIFFAVSCTFFDNAQNEEQVSSYQDRIDQRIDEINEQLLENPDQENLIIEKGELLLNLADLMANPYDRIPVYRDLYSLSLETNGLQNHIVKAWSDEQASGIRLLQTNRNDESADHSDAILAHFHNAITLQPDSLVTYSLLATTYYETGSIHHAIDILENAIEISGQNDKTLYEKLAYLYLEAGRTDVSVQMYQNLVAEYPDDNHLMHGLANAYILSNRHEEAITTLRQLIELYPTRYSYQEALAAQLYYQYKDQSDKFLKSDPQSDFSISELILLIHEIDEIFNSLTNNTPVNEENIYRMAAFYKNSTGILNSISEFADLGEELSQQFNEISIDHAEKALLHWERLAEMNPENLEYLTVLHQIYLQHGMREEADLIERSYNF